MHSFSWGSASVAGSSDFNQFVSSLASMHTILFSLCPFQMPCLQKSWLTCPRSHPERQWDGAGPPAASSRLLSLRSQRGRWRAAWPAAWPSPERGYLQGNDHSHSWVSVLALREWHAWGQHHQHQHSETLRHIDLLENAPFRGFPRVVRVAESTCRP